MNRKESTSMLTYSFLSSLQMLSSQCSVTALLFLFSPHFPNPQEIAIMLSVLSAGECKIENCLVERQISRSTLMVYVVLSLISTTQFPRQHFNGTCQDMKKLPFSCTHTHTKRPLVLHTNKHIKPIYFVFISSSSSSEFCMCHNSW